MSCGTFTSTDAHTQTHASKHTHTLVLTKAETDHTQTAACPTAQLMIWVKYIQYKPTANPINPYFV